MVKVNIFIGQRSTQQGELAQLVERLLLACKIQSFNSPIYVWANGVLVT